MSNHTDNAGTEGGSIINGIAGAFAGCLIAAVPWVLAGVLLKQRLAEPVRFWLMYFPALCVKALDNTGVLPSHFSLIA